MADLGNQLNEILRECISNFESDAPLSPAVLAMMAMKRLDEGGVAPVLVAYSSNLNLRQMARNILRREFDPIEKAESGQVEMFDKLQDRYPCERNGELVYVVRMQMRLEERRRVENRMRLAGVALIEHSDSMRAETDSLEAQGYFNAASEG